MKPASDIKIINAPYTRWAEILRHHGPNVRFVDRGTDWGNPFIMDHEDERDYVCDMFEKYAIWRLSVEPTWLDRLRDQHLVCHCAPKRCNAETLRRLANERR